MSRRKPEILHLAPEKLIVDQRVQRVTNRFRVEKMAQKLNPEALGVLLVSDRGDGTMHIIDGGHRRAAVVAAGRDDLLLECKVYYDLARAEEAAMFRLANTTKSVQATDKFRVRVVEEDPAAVRINNVLVRNGWTVELGKKAGTFAAVRSLEEIYDGFRNGPSENIGTVETLISVVTAAFDHNPDGVRREIISGVGFVLLRHDNIDLKKLTAELASYPGGPSGLVGAASGLYKLRKGRIADSMAEIVVNLVNSGRRVNRIPDWRDVA